MSSLWEFIRQKDNREVLGWLGGGLVVLVTGLWAAVVYFLPPQKSSEPRAPNVQANCAGVAVGGNVTGTTITAGTTISADCSSKPK